MSRDRFHTWSEDREGIIPWYERMYERFGTVQAMADFLGITKQTVYCWDRHPELIRVSHLRDYLRRGLITPEEILRIIEPKGGKNDIQER